MIYLLLSIACSTVIFVLFKLFGKYEVSNLQAIISNYVVAATLGWLPLYSVHHDGLELTSWSFWPLLIGFLFITLFQLMARITQISGVNVVSVTVKMSVAIPILFGLLWHHEKLHIINYAGILVAIMAVLFINKPEDGSGFKTKKWTGPLILFIGSGILDALMKIIETNVVTDGSTAQFTGTAFGVAGCLGILYLIFKIYVKQQEQWSIKSWIWGIALGVPNFGSIYFLLKALEGDWASAIIFPINNVGIVALSALVAYALFKEKITGWKALGLVLAISAIYMLSIS